MGSPRKNTKLAALAACVLLAVIAGAALYWRHLSSARRQANELTPVIARSSRKPGQETVVAGDQKSRVQSLLSQKKYDLAISEARRYYNAAPLTQTGAAVQRLAAAIRQSTLYKEDPQFADKLVAQQQAGALTKNPDATLTTPNLLKTIPLDAEPYEAKIQGLQGSDKYDELMACGDLLLLADRCVEAREAFLSAVKLAKSTDKKLFDAVEGVARSIRAETGYAGPANAMILDLALGEKPDVLAGIPEERWQKGDMQIAGQRVLLAQLMQPGKGGASPKPASDEEASTDESVNRQSVGAAPAGYDLGDPLVVAALSPEPDSELVLWLNDWQKQMRDASPASAPAAGPDLQSRLKVILADTNLPCLLLLHLGHAYQFRCGPADYATAALYYGAAADRVEAELKEGVNPVQQAAILRGMKDHMGGYKTVLWSRVDSRDSGAADALYKIYIAYLQHVPATDRALSRPVTHIKIGAAECLYVRGDLDAAVVLLDTIKNVEMERGERTAYEWACAVVLFRLQRYGDSIPHLRYVTEHANVHSAKAWPLLIRALAGLGDHGAANVAFDTWVRSFHPSVAEAAPVLDAIDQYAN